jgi:serine protease Do
MSMSKKEVRTSVSIIIPLVFALLAASCATPATPITPEVPTPTVATVAAEAAASPTQVPPVVTSGDGLLAALETSLETLYNAVNPSVVNIQVVQTVQGGVPSSPNSPFSGPQAPQQQQQVLGSGFVWDTQGHIVTNNHVVEGASQITVTFADQTSVPAQIVGTDPDSDLAVLGVNVPASELHPVQEATAYAKVGQIAIAIGNPFGLQGSMSMGIVSAIGRSLPVGSNAMATGPSYTIPAVIQTDAPINPGNSGGVLVDDEGRVIGVTAAIVSASGSSSGVGFAIPVEIVQMVVPALIQNGHYDHPYIGVSGTTLTPSLASAMNLAEQQRGALLVDITPGGPAAQAGLKGSDKTADINGQSVPVGGDVVIAIGDQPITSFDDLAADVALNTQVGETVTLQIIRNGQEQNVDITIGARPAAQTAAAGASASQAAYLGIVGINLTPNIAAAMSLPTDQTGVLIEQIQNGGPADQAGLQGGDQPTVIDGQTVLLGGDVITAIDNQPVADMSGLQGLLGNYSPNQQATLTVLRGGRTLEVQVVLG